MGALFSLLTSFTGRINRAKWWLGLVVLGMANIAGGLLIDPDFFLADDEPPPPSLPDMLWQTRLPFHDRINRARWRIGFVITGFGGMIGTVIFNPELLTGDGIFAPNWPGMLWQIAWLVPFTAIVTKRCNNRDWPSWLPWLIPALCALVYLSPHVDFDVDPEAGFAGALTFWVVVVALVALIIDNGFIRGTDGPNRYGPHPLAEGQTPA